MDAHKVCSDCNVAIVYSGYTDDQWGNLSRQERDSIKKYGAIKTREQIIIEQQEQERQKQILEQKKQEFAKSFQEYYEYDVVTIINEDHGRVDKEHMLKILSDHAKEGWKLHTIYSNELGKNAIRVLGFGTNSTACEDVLIFERRIENLQ